MRGSFDKLWHGLDYFCVYQRFFQYLDVVLPNILNDTDNVVIYASKYFTKVWKRWTLYNTDCLTFYKLLLRIFCYYDYSIFFLWPFFNVLMKVKKGFFLRDKKLFSAWCIFFFFWSWSRFCVWCTTHVFLSTLGLASRAWAKI